MKFLLMKASNYEFRREIAVNSLEELREIAEKYRHGLVIDFRRNMIIIYDDYLE